MFTYELTEAGKRFVNQCKVMGAIPYVERSGGHRINLASADQDQLAAFWKLKSKYILRKAVPAAPAAPASKPEAQGKP